MLIPHLNILCKVICHANGAYRSDIKPNTLYKEPTKQQWNPLIHYVDVTRHTVGIHWFYSFFYFCPPPLPTPPPRQNGSTFSDISNIIITRQSLRPNIFTFICDNWFNKIDSVAIVIQFDSLNPENIVYALLCSSICYMHIPSVVSHICIENDITLNINFCIKSFLNTVPRILFVNGYLYGHKLTSWYLIICNKHG